MEVGIIISFFIILYRINARPIFPKYFVFRLFVPLSLLDTVAATPSNISYTFQSDSVHIFCILKYRSLR